MCCPSCLSQRPFHFRCEALLALCHKLNDTTGLGDLLLGQLADVSCADNNGGLRQTALAEQLGVAQSGEVDDGGGFGLGQVLLARLGGDQRPQLWGKGCVLVTGCLCPCRRALLLDWTV